MLSAKDVMTEHIIYVEAGTPIRKALELLIDYDISGIPVVEGGKNLVGVITERDVLGLFSAPEDVEGKTVGDFMTQPAVSFEEHENLSDVCRCLADYYFRRVPVTSQGRLVGIISRRDIIRNILDTTSQNVTAR